ncbi:putative radical-activating enzyme [Pseudomonas aeruginosa PA38182]|nr:putative radical-activating enzyme [Pseudomonas aeruginosa PA38182]
MSATLRVGGLVPLTTLDYPGLLACVLFCQAAPGAAATATTRN